MERKSKVIFNVTQSLIDKGIRDSECSCPMALAIIEQLPKGSKINVAVTEDSIDLWLYNHILAEFPNPAWMKITLYDHGHTMLPFTFELDTEKWKRALYEATIAEPDREDEEDKSRIEEEIT